MIFYYFLVLYLFLIIILTMGVKGLTKLIVDNKEKCGIKLTQRYGTRTCSNPDFQNVVLLLMGIHWRTIFTIARLIVVWHLATILLISIIWQGK